ncbi:hypothetical protein [Campylobacter gracilis]|uniref:Tat pathway signal sequence domain protein n=1 Tax=Campylobacter gracilis RM3268 TaxID=553220 RepID=C8PK55_9BACT|nr:hypothetical protein [Campylobacter gracilis]EEV16749.1 Tat pathway signal sequence domain protein [Campylobacter gracilis RM3268]UEB44815.1 hypothetical protein LK410_07305 [Campylobacter gracilis]SUW78656.1 Uncharacterised protein [Campylobacter gracilis]
MNKNELKNILGGYFGREIAGDFRVLKEHEIARCKTRRNFLLRAIASCCASFVSLQIAAPAICGS